MTFESKSKELAKTACAFWHLPEMVERMFDWAMEERTEACIAICKEREEAHKETLKHSKSCDRAEIQHRADEAGRCARRIREALEAYREKRC